jgi:arylamine N-acetyltransferase
MDGEEIKCPNGSSYKVTESKYGVFSLSVLREEGFFTFYTFDMGLYTEVDFNLSSYFSNTHPQSKHAHNLVMSINENKVTKAILNRMRITIVNGIKAKEEVIQSAGDLKLTLDSDYAIKVSDKEATFLYDTFI